VTYEQHDIDQMGDGFTKQYNGMIERYVYKFKARGERRATKGAQRRRPKYSDFKGMK